MLQTTEITQNTRTELRWLWRVNCPDCHMEARLTMSHQCLTEQTHTLIREGGFITKPALCEECGAPSQVKFELYHGETLVGCLTEDPQDRTPMTNPEIDPMIAYNFSRN